MVTYREVDNRRERGNTRMQPKKATLLGKYNTHIKNIDTAQDLDWEFHYPTQEKITKVSRVVCI